MNVGKCYENTQLSTALKPLEASRKFAGFHPDFFGVGVCAMLGD